VIASLRCNTSRGGATLRAGQHLIHWLVWWLPVGGGGGYVWQSDVVVEHSQVGDISVCAPVGCWKGRLAS
jgi:hypothetical protein